MGFQSMTFQPETFAQANPVLTGIQAAQQTQANAYNNQIAAARAQYAQQMGAQGLRQAILNNQVLGAKAQTALPQANATTQILQNTANYAPEMSQSSLANQSAQRGLMGAQSGYYGANAGLIGQEAQKAAFFNQHPTSMLPGVAGNIANYALLRQLMPGEFGQNQVAPPTQNQVVANDLSNGTPTTLPGMPSAGMFSSSPRQGVFPILLPPGAIGSQQAPMQQQTFNGGISYAQNASIQQPVSPQVQSGGMGGLPSVQDFGNMMMQGQLAPIQKNIAQTNFYNSKAQGYQFSLLPPNQKAYLMAQASGMGYEPLQAENYLTSGATLAQLAQAKGLDPNNMPSPIYPASSQTVNLIQRRNQALNEINSIMPNINDSLAPYAQRFNGYSPSQISGAISNDNPDQQARFLAAKALMPEMASLRLKAMGGQIGIEAIREVNNASMGNMKSFQSLVNPKVYSAAQNYVDQWIQQGAQAANKSGLGGSMGNFGGQNPSNQTLSPNSAPQMVTVIAPNGSRVNIPSSNLGAALKRGARQA